MNYKSSFTLLFVLLLLALLNPRQISFAGPNPPQPTVPAHRPFKPLRRAMRTESHLWPNATTNIAEPLSCRPLGAVITGTVTAQDTGQPLDAYVEADYYGGYGDSAFTDEQGHYVLKNLSPGPHQIYFQSRDAKYASEWYDDHTLGSAATTVNATVGLTITNINATLNFGGFISGLVTAADTGKPVADALVEVTDTEDHTVIYADTDGNGYYATDTLRSGSYHVLFKAKNYLTEYYHDQPNANSATPVVVTALGATSSNINAALTRSGRILGRVTTSDTGVGVADVGIDVIADDGYHLMYTSTDSTGNYTVTGLATGGYRLQTGLFNEDVFTPYIIDQWYNNKTSLSTANTIAVTAPNDTTNINFSLKRGGQITGQVTMADTGNSLPNTYLFVAVYDSEGRFVSSTHTQESGFYTTTGLPSGSYKVKFEPNPYDASAPYTGEWYNHKPNVDSADLVVVTAPGVTRNIDAVLDLGAQICGRITVAGSGVGLSDTYVNIYDLAGHFITSPDADPYGYYITTGLRTGAYQVYTSPFSNSKASAYLPEWYNDKPDRATANPVSVIAPALTPNIDFALAGGTNVTSGAGGTVTNMDGIKLTFPAGAVPQDTRVTLTTLSGPTQPLPNGQAVLYSFSATATTLNGQTITQFAKPYTLQVPYTDAQLASIGLADPAKLNVGFWSNNIWTPLLPCAGCSIDQANKTVTVVVNHFTDFALIGQGTTSNNGHHIFLPFVRR